MPNHHKKKCWQSRTKLKTPTAEKSMVDLQVASVPPQAGDLDDGGGRVACVYHNCDVDE